MTSWALPFCWLKAYAYLTSHGSWKVDAVSNFWNAPTVSDIGNWDFELRQEIFYCNSLIICHKILKQTLFHRIFVTLFVPANLLHYFFSSLYVRRLNFNSGSFVLLHVKIMLNNVNAFLKWNMSWKEFLDCVQFCIYVYGKFFLCKTVFAFCKVLRVFWYKKLWKFPRFKEILRHCARKLIGRFY